MALTLKQLVSDGDFTKGSPLSSAEIDGNFIFLKSKASVTVLDDISYMFDGTTTSFPLTFNGSAVTIENPHALMVTLGSSLLQPSTSYDYEGYVFQQEIDVGLKGNYTVTNNRIKFSQAPTQAQRFYGRLLGSYVNQPRADNIFRAIPVVLS